MCRWHGRVPPEAGKVDDKQGRDMVGLAPEVLLPEALLPEAEALHVLVVVTEGCKPKGGTLQTRKAVWLHIVRILSKE